MACSRACAPVAAPCRAAAPPHGPAPPRASLPRLASVQRGTASALLRLPARARAARCRTRASAASSAPAPAGEQAARPKALPHGFAGIVFDMDGASSALITPCFALELTHRSALACLLCEGTLTVSNIDFATMRAQTGIPAGDLFTVMEEWRDASRVAAAMDVILGLEAEAQRTLQLQPGLEALLTQCVADGLRLAIVTRNTDDAVDALFARLGERWRAAFSPVLTRHFRFVKPDRRLLLHVADAWGVPPSAMLMVGDSREDVEIGAICGAATCLIAGGGNETNAAAAAAAVGVQPTFAVRSLGELAERLRVGGPGLAAPAALPRGVPFLAALLEAGVIAAAACSYPGLGAAGRGFAPCEGAAPKVLHLDCGDGAFTKTAHSHGLDARGLDCSEDAAQAARARGLAATAVAALVPGALGAEADAAFDCLLCIAERGAPSLLFDAAGAARPGALAEAARALRQGGALAVEWHGPHAQQDAAAAAQAAQAAGLAVSRMGDARIVAVKP